MCILYINLQQVEKSNSLVLVFRFTLKVDSFKYKCSEENFLY